MFDQTPTQNNFMGAPVMGGYQFNGMQQMPKIMNTLSDAEIKELQQTNSNFSLGLTQKEVLQGACNHRSADGTSDTLVFDQATGMATCTICGYQFRPIEADESFDAIKESADKLVDILQTIKIMYTDIPAPAAREYFQIIPLIGKVPELFKYAAKNFAKHDYNAWSYNNHNMGGAAMFQNLYNMSGAPMGGFQPQMGYAAAPQQPVGYPNPNMAMPGVNPFGYAGASQQPMGYAPMTQGFQYQPNQVNTPVAPTVTAPAAPAEAEDTTVIQKVTV